MSSPDYPTIPQDLEHALLHHFFIRFTTTGRHSRLSRTTETTFVWRRHTKVPDTIFISGYPGKRDWLANAKASTTVTFHTVEEGIYYDIPTSPRVIVDRSERTEYLLAFLDRWANHPASGLRLFRWLVGAIRFNQRLRLPWWGPFYIVRRVMDRMPCLELTVTGPPTLRTTPPPSVARSEGK